MQDNVVKTLDSFRSLFSRCTKSLFFLVSFFSVLACSYAAQAYDIAKGTIVIEGVRDDVISVRQGTKGQKTLLQPGAQVRITGKSQQFSVTVKNGARANLLLDNVAIDLKERGGACAFEILAGSHANVSLKGKNRLVSGSGRAGLEVVSGAYLHISDGEKNSLEAIGGEYGAGIGGPALIGQAIPGGFELMGMGFACNSGSITISGGSVTTQGGRGAPGIGGGFVIIDDKTESRGSGAINIEGGEVRATGGEGASGIGGDGSNIRISGGSVVAVGQDYGAGIGNGSSCSGGRIEISGGSVLARGLVNGPGIGGSERGSGKAGTILITGGNVEAHGGPSAAGIGGGLFGDGGKVTIWGGQVRSFGGSSGIGGGIEGTSGGVLIVHGGTVTATGRAVYDIGPGNSSTTEGRIIVTGGSLLPTRGSNFVTPAPTNGITQVLLNTLVLGERALPYGTLVTGGRAAFYDMNAVSAPTKSIYGIQDVRTDQNGAVHLWLPEKLSSPITLRTEKQEFFGMGGEGKNVLELMKTEEPDPVQ